MKLLFDQNLSPRLSKRLADLFPGSQHVNPLGLGSVLDNQVWDFAKANDFAVVTKDEDYSHLSVVRGTPPKVIWLLTGNCTTAKIESLLRSRAADIIAFGADPDAGVLAIA